MSTGEDSTDMLVSTVRIPLARLAKTVDNITFYINYKSLALVFLKQQFNMQYIVIESEMNNLQWLPTNCLTIMLIVCFFLGPDVQI